MGKGPEETFFKKKHSNNQQVHEKMLISQIIRGVPIKTTMRCPLTPVRMAVRKQR